MYASRSLARLRGPAAALRVRPLQVQFARCFSDERGMKAVTVFQRQRLPPNLGFVVRSASAWDEQADTSVERRDSPRGRTKSTGLD